MFQNINLLPTLIITISSFLRRPLSKVHPLLTGISNETSQTQQDGLSGHRLMSQPASWACPSRAQKTW